MKKLIAIIAACIALASACSSDNKSNWEKYADWREYNNNWLKEMEKRTNPDGTPYYEKIVPSWNPKGYVLMHYFNDRKLTEGNLSPMYTSTVDVRYKVHLCDGTIADSSDNVTSTGKKGIYRAQLKSLVQGWSVALPEMRCGDTAEVIVPYSLAYAGNNNSVIPPYSNLQFNIRLVDIPNYETPDLK